MPELPEVEVTRRRIAPTLVGRTIAEITTSASRRPFLTRPALLREKLVGCRVEAVERHGKYLFLVLSDGARLCVHLGMTGQLVTPGAFQLSGPARGSRLRTARDRHVHLEVRFVDSGPSLCFRDPRMFGKVFRIGPGQKSERLRILGPDALTIDAEEFSRAVRGRRAPIKSVLLDQKLLAGVGNIYADEALYISHLRPTRRAFRLTRADCIRLHTAILHVLARGIEEGGTTISDFVHPDGTEGRFQRCFRVYQRDGQPCPECGTRIRRVVIGQRSSHFCPTCQR